MFTVNIIVADDVLDTAVGLTQQLLDDAISGIERAAALWSRYIDGNNAVIDIDLDFADLSGNTLAQAGSFFTLVRDEFQTGVDGNPLIEGSFTIDLPRLIAGNFLFTNNIDFVQNPGAGQIDFLTLAAHELGHVFGFLGTSIFNAFVVNNMFVGANAMAANGGNPVALASDGVHILANDLLSPSISNNLREPLTAIHIAILQDLGLPIVTATQAANTLYGFNASDDTLNGLGGDDIIDGLTGNDNLRGGTGNDTIFGGEGLDTINGGNDNDVIFGGIGDDILRGQASDDTIEGGEGSDTVTGGIGNDYLSSGAGSDTILGQGNEDTLFGGADIDFLFGGSGNDTIYGGSQDDTLFGQGNNDVLNGGDGDDSLSGANGIDVLFGGAGNDQINGSTGRDTLDGGSGNDTLSGGTQIDVFVFAEDYDADRINGYEQGLDRLNLDDNLWFTDFGSLTAQEVVEQFGSLNGSSTILTLDFGNGDILEIQNGGGITMATLFDDLNIV